MPCNMWSKGKAVSPFPSQHILKPQGTILSTAADTEPWARVHPINPSAEMLLGEPEGTHQLL